MLRLCEGDAREICQDCGDPLQFYQQIPGLTIQGPTVGAKQGGKHYVRFNFKYVHYITVLICVSSRIHVALVSSKASKAYLQV